LQRFLPEIHTREIPRFILKLIEEDPELSEKLANEFTNREAHLATLLAKYILELYERYRYEVSGIL